MSDPTEIEEVLTAGIVGPHRESHEPRLMADQLLADGVVPEGGYFAFDATHGITNFGMDHNGPDSGNPEWAPGGLGCCGIAAPDHGNMCKSGKKSQYRQIGRPKFAGTIGTYCAYGVAMAEQAQAPAPENCPDNGVDNATLFAWMYKEGLFDWTDDAGVVHEGGYAEVPLNMLDWFAKTFNGAVIGLAFDGNQASADFSSRPRRIWDAMQIVDGHDTYYAKSVGDGTGTLITWGGLQLFSLPFRSANITDAWVFFDKNDPAINRPALEAALQAVHGTVDVSSEVVATTIDIHSEIDELFKKCSHALYEAFHSAESAEQFVASEKRVKELEQGLHHAMGLALSRESETLILDVLKMIVKNYIR